MKKLFLTLMKQITKNLKTEFFLGALLILVLSIVFPKTSLAAQAFPPDGTSWGAACGGSKDQLECCSDLDDRCQQGCDALCDLNPENREIGDQDWIDCLDDCVDAMQECLLAANAGENLCAVWSCNAMAAVPAIPAVRDQLYEVRAGRVIFKEGRSGTINLFCPITRDLGPSLRSLVLTYRDGDGHEGPSVVSAALRRVNRKTGHVTSFEYGGVSSNDDGNPSYNEDPAPNSGLTGWATHQSARPGRTLLNQNHQMDLMNFYYYVQITMKRTNGVTPLAVMGAYLTD